MVRPWSPFVPVALLLAAGAAFGTIGARAIRLEAQDAARRARARAELDVGVAASAAPTRAAEGLGAERYTFRLVAPSPASAVAQSSRPEGAAALGTASNDGPVVPDDVRLLLDQAAYLERRGDENAAADVYARIASRNDLGSLAMVASVHAGASRVAAGAGPDAEGLETNGRGDDMPAVSDAQRPLVSLEGVPLGPWAAVLRVIAAVRAGASSEELTERVGTLLHAHGSDGARTDGGPDGLDCVLVADEALAERRGELSPGRLAAFDRAVTRARLAHRFVRALESAPVAAADQFIAAKDRTRPYDVRLVSVGTFATALSKALATNVRATTASDTIPAGAARVRVPSPLDGLWLYSIPDPGPSSGSGPWLLLVGALFVYSLGAGTIVYALGKSRRAQRMQADFVAAVSHEMKTPVAGVRAMAEMLAESKADPERAHLYAERIVVEMDRLGASVRDVLDAARIERDPTSVVRPRLVEPSAVVAEAAAVVRPALERRGFTVDVETTPAGGPVVLDPDAISHVLHNLLDNAAKFSGQDGARREIEVRAGPARVAASGERAGLSSRYRIEVMDRGPGVPASERPRVFERFVRGEAARRQAVPGVGLGLHVAKALVEAHGGTIAVTDREGGGARFVVELPAAT